MTGPIPHAKGRRLVRCREVLEQIEALPPGRSWVYHIDGEKRCLGTWAAVWKAYEDGLVVPLQKRDEDGQLLYIAKRRQQQTTEA